MRRILVVYWWPDDLEMRLAVEQHLRALDRGPDTVVYLNAYRRPPRWHRLESYDTVVLHTTFLCLRWSSDFGRRRREWSWLAALDCPKIALPQDEYDHAAVLDDWLAELGVSTVFSNFDEQTRAPLYPHTRGRARFFEALTGYIDPEAAAYSAKRARPHAARPYDIVYRALQLPFWFGSHGQLKHRIGVASAERAEAHGLRVDISTRPEDTIFGRGWLDFVMSGRAIVGAESGSSVLDSRGYVQRRIRELLELEPALTFEEVDARMPPGWDSYAFFAISPRHLEAVIARTCQILVAGMYSGVLVPERHYIPVRRDLSDLDDALARIADVAHAQEVADRAYQDVFVDGAWTTDDFARQLRERFGDRPRRRRRTQFLPAARAGEEAATAFASRAGHGLRPRLRTVSIRARSAVTALAPVRRRPLLAKLLARTLATGLRTGVVGRDLARDLVRLDALDRFEQEQSTRGGRWRVRAETNGDDLVLVTAPRDGVEYERPRLRRVQRIVWDHSRFGDSGSSERYEFAALSRLARLHPDLPWTEALLRGDDVEVESE